MSAVGSRPTPEPNTRPTPTAAGKPVTDVACGVIWSADKRFLLAQRPKGRVWAGYWEFPGGKIEPGESPGAALQRELLEELGIHVVDGDAWLVKTFDYPHGRVRLHFFHVRNWTGNPMGLEGQQLYWQTAGTPCDVTPVLPANIPILRALGMPDLIPITPFVDVQHREAIERVDARLSSLHRPHSAEWLLVRRGPLTAMQWQDWAVVARHHQRIAIINAEVDRAKNYGAVGLHLTSARLANCDRRPHFDIVGASVHNCDDIERAAELELDYVVLGSVQATASHPGKPGLGWFAWAGIARDCPLPIYAIGGLQVTDIKTSHRHGACGVALIQGAWDP